MNGSMPGLFKSTLKAEGFSLIEIVVVMLIIGIITSFTVPLFLKRSDSSSKEFINNLNTLINHGSLDAILEKKVHRVVFDYNNNRVTLEKSSKETLDMQDTQEQFSSASSQYIATSIDWPSSLHIKHFFIGKIDEITGNSTQKIWFYIGSDGTIQNVVIVILDDQTDTTMSLVTNPFTTQLTVYDGIKKPS